MPVDEFSESLKLCKSRGGITEQPGEEWATAHEPMGGGLFPPRATMPRPPHEGHSLRILGLTPLIKAVHLLDVRPVKMAALDAIVAAGTMSEPRTMVAPDTMAATGFPAILQRGE